jgi:hypothetical protein
MANPGSVADRTRGRLGRLPHVTLVSRNSAGPSRR